MQFFDDLMKAGNGLVLDDLFLEALDINFDLFGPLCELKGRDGLVEGVF